MTTFIYVINGTEIEDTTAFGKAWKEAKAMATEEHTVIKRAVVKGDKIRYEIYVNGGCFLDDNEENQKRAKIW